MVFSKCRSIAIKSFFLTLSVFILSACEYSIFDPKGTVGQQNREILIVSVLLILLIVIPTLLMVFYVAFKYREGSGATYTPEWSHSNKIEFYMWFFPILIILALGTITWYSTHHLDPANPASVINKPFNTSKIPQSTVDEKYPSMKIQVVAMNWRWLFIYPKEGIATINHVAFPKDTRVEFSIAASDIMNVFFIPRLGSQIYGMGGMVTKLNLVANEPGNYKGISANYSGAGFSKMKFVAAVLPSQEKFNDWVNEVKESPLTIASMKDYKELAKPNIDSPVYYFSSYPKMLFMDINMMAMREPQTILYDPSEH